MPRRASTSFYLNLIQIVIYLGTFLVSMPRRASTSFYPNFYNVSLQADNVLFQCPEGLVLRSIMIMEVLLIIL